MQAGVQYDTGEVHGKRRRGRPKTSYSGNIAKWMGGNMKTIMRYICRQLVRGAARAADHHSWWGPGKEEDMCV